MEPLKPDLIALSGADLIFLAEDGDFETFPFDGEAMEHVLGICGQPTRFATLMKTTYRYWFLSCLTTMKVSVSKHIR